MNTGCIDRKLRNDVGNIQSFQINSQGEFCLIRQRRNCRVRIQAPHFSFKYSHVPELKKNGKIASENQVCSCTGKGGERESEVERQ